MSLRLLQLAARRGASVGLLGSEVLAPLSSACWATSGGGSSSVSSSSSASTSGRGGAAAAVAAMPAASAAAAVGAGPSGGGGTAAAAAVTAAAASSSSSAAAAAMAPAWRGSSGLFSSSATTGGAPGSSGGGSGPPGSSSSSGGAPGSSGGGGGAALQQAAAYGVAAHYERHSVAPAAAHEPLPQAPQAHLPDADVETEPYTVSVVTGNVRGAGTSSAAYVQLVGSSGASEKFVIGSSHEDGLARGSRVVFDVHVPAGIGPLRRVFVERAPASCTDTGEGWFLEAVDVRGPHGEHYLFPCNSWFGQSDCGDHSGALERNLLPLVASDALPEVRARPVAVAVSGVAFPHPEKVAKNKIRGVNMRGFGYGGEDAYFYASGPGVFGMGVADGVYMWKELGIDSGTMARTLMETCQHMVAAGCEDVYKVLAVAARHVESEGVQGSCTACLLTINRATGKLQSATLGDSGYLVVGPPHGASPAPVRDGQARPLMVKFRTAQMEHEFGCPYQLGHHAYANSPSDADLATLPLVPGDVVVMGSDGLLDNMSDQEIVDEVGRLLAAGARPGAMAQQLAKTAFDNSLDRGRATPYSRAATEAFDMVYSGGKPDDITVLVAVVSCDDGGGVRIDGSGGGGGGGAAAAAAGGGGNGSS